MSIGDSRTSLFLKQWHCGDREGLDALLQCHLSWLHSRVRHRMGPLLRRRAETSDYVQDVVIRFLRDAPRFILTNDASFRALLLKIVENTLRDRHDWFTARRRAIAKERPLPSDTLLVLDAPERPVTTPSKYVEQHEQEAWIRLGMEFLDPEEREVIILRQWDGLSFAEVGKRFGLQSNAAWKKHDRAVCRLGEIVSTLRSGRVDQLIEEDSEGEENHGRC